MKRSRWFLGLLAYALLALAPIDAGRAQPASSAAIPVSVTQVTRRDVPVTLQALGTVQPFQTVTIRARVDGTLDKVLFTEGQIVRPGDVLAQLDPRPYQAVLDQALAKKAADEAALASARSDLTRYSELATAQIASRQKFEQARALVGQTEAAVRGDEATIAAAQLNLSFTRITAPIEGRVGLRLLDPGNYIRTADPNGPGIATITQIHPIALTFTLPQDLLGQIQSAMRRGPIPVRATKANGTGQSSTGTLLTIDSSIDTTTGTLKLKAIFENRDDALWPGQFVNVQIQTDVIRDAPTLPSAAIQHGPAGLYVYVVKDDATVARVPVTIAQDDGTIATLASGLSGGETAVVSGQLRLTNGTRVAISAAKPAG